MNRRVPAMSCPACDVKVIPKTLSQGVCSCGSNIRTTLSYERLRALSVALMVSIAGIYSYTPSSGGSWLFKTLLFFIPANILFTVCVPPRLELGTPRRFKVTYAGCVLASALTTLAVGFVGFGWAGLFVGASKTDLYEHFASLSIPLGLISRRFVITSDKSFVDVCGIILGNSLFNGFLLFLCYTAVKRAFQRSRTVRLDLSSKPLTDDD